MDKKQQNRKKRVTRLRVVKLTPKQTHFMGELLTYFHGRRLHALKYLKDNPDYVEAIPLTKIYALHKCNAKDRQAVKIAACVFFKQVKRGSNLTGRCSEWSPLKIPHVNEQVKRMLTDLYAFNIDHQRCIRTYLNTPKDEHAVEITSTFLFKSKEQADAFAELMEAIDIELEE